jgi:hypothetical protein
MIDIVSTFRSYALSQDGSQRPPDEVIPVRVSLLLEAAAENERLQTQRDTAISFIRTLYPITISSSERAIAHRLYCEANGFFALSGDKHE